MENKIVEMETKIANYFGITRSEVAKWEATGVGSLALWILFDASFYGFAVTMLLTATIMAFWYAVWRQKREVKA